MVQIASAQNKVTEFPAFTSLQISPHTSPWQRSSGRLNIERPKEQKRWRRRRIYKKVGKKVRTKCPREIGLGRGRHVQARRQHNHKTRARQKTCGFGNQVEKKQLSYVPSLQTPRFKSFLETMQNTNNNAFRRCVSRTWSQSPLEGHNICTSHLHRAKNRTHRKNAR